MKKLLTLMSVSILGSSLASSVVSCGAVKPVPGLDDPGSVLRASGTANNTHKYINNKGEEKSDARYNDISTWSTATMANPDYMAAFMSNTFQTGAGADVTSSLESTTASTYTDYLTKDSLTGKTAEIPYWLLTNYEVNDANSGRLDDVFGINGMPDPHNKNTKISDIAPYFTKVYNHLIRDFNITLWSSENKTYAKKGDKTPTADWYNSTNFNIHFSKDGKHNVLPLDMDQSKKDKDGWTTNKDVISETAKTGKDDDKTSSTWYTVSTFISVEPRFDAGINVAAIDGFIGARDDYIIGNEPIAGKDTSKGEVYNSPERNNLVDFYSDKNTIGSPTLETKDMIVSLYNKDDDKSNAFIMNDKVKNYRGIKEQALQFKPGAKGAKSFDYRYAITFSWSINSVG